MHGALVLNDHLRGVTSSRVTHRLRKQTYLLEKDDGTLGAKILQGGVVIHPVTPDLPLQAPQEGTILLSFILGDERS